MVDVDLSILGQREAVFRHYEHQISREYGTVPPELFCKGRATILQSFLDRDSIYLTNYFRKKYEQQARLNLQASIERLGRMELPFIEAT